MEAKASTSRITFLPMPIRFGTAEKVTEAHASVVLAFYEKIKIRSGRSYCAFVSNVNTPTGNSYLHIDSQTTSSISFPIKVQRLVFTVP